MPELSEEMFLGAIDALVAADQHRLSDDPELSLYLRPLMFANEANLMLRPSREYQFILMAFIAGGFFGPVLRPVQVWVERDAARAFPGGTGDVKCAANYAGAFLAQRKAEQVGCQQVVWLDAGERRWVEELGGMNLFFIRGHGSAAEVVTPELTGTLLPGVTRDSLLTLAARLGHPIGQQRISLDQWRTECEQGIITETFACGTAAVVTPISEVRDGDDIWTAGDATAGPVTMGLRQALIDVQHGTAPDPGGWLYRVPQIGCRRRPPA
jgi:branched-chain amino acid aminotransferase